MVVAVVVAAALAFLLCRLPFMRSLEARVGDAFMRATADLLEADRTIAVAMLDEQGALRVTLAENGEPLSWPWPREAWGLICEHLRRHGATAVFLDLLLTEPSRPEVRDEDEALGEAVSSSGNVYAAFQLHRRALPRSDHPVQKEVTAASRRLFAERVDAIEASKVATYEDVLLPIDPLMRGAAGMGFVNVPADSDGIVRRVPIAARVGDRVVPCLELAAAIDLLGDQRCAIDDRGLHLGDRVIPLWDEAEVGLRLHGGVGTYDLVPLGDLALDAFLSADPGYRLLVPPERIKGRTFFVGVSRSGLDDVIATALADPFLGTELRAHVFDLLKNGGAVMPAPSWLVPVLCFLGASIAVLLLLLNRRVAIAYGGVLASHLLLLAGVFFALKLDMVVAALAPSLSLWLGAVCGGALRALTEGRRNRWLESTFSLYLSPAVIERLKEDPSRLHLGGQRAEVTVFFSDIAGFTSFSEKLRPEQLARLLNQYLTLVSDCLLEEGATLDKYIGDAVMAFFGDPITQSDQRDRALHAAVRHPELLQRLRPVLEELGVESFKVRIGIHTGDAVIGNFGSNRRFAYTAMGDTVNLASRLEGLNKYFGTEVLLSDDVKRGIRSEDLFTREVGLISVKGRAQPVRIHELLSAGRKVNLNYQRGLEHFRLTQWEEASRCFADPVLEADGPSEFYRLRIAEILAGQRPPDAGGVIVMDAK